MLYQIEVTTYCNLQCFYCPIETIENTHMKYEKFCKIVDEFEPKSIVRLQGIGESFLHPKFYEMVLYIKQKGHIADVITNGTTKIESKYIELLDSIGFSIDTLNKIQAKKSKRDKIEATLENLFEIYIKNPKKVKIFAVDYGQDLSSLIELSKKYHIPLTVQNLQNKTSYQNKYQIEKKPYLNYSCKYIENDVMKFYFVDGSIAPCHYIVKKEITKSKEEIKKMLDKKIVPKCCNQCDELLKGYSYGK